MPIYLTAAVKPTGNFPVFQDTDGYGGFQVRSTTSDRDSIPSSSRKSGMLVYVLADGYFYQLNSNLTTWSIASFNASNIQGNPVSSTAPTSGQVLAWNGSSWIPTSPTVVGGATNASLGTIQLSGDLSGTASSPKVAGIQGYSVSSAQPGDGYIMLYKSGSPSQWQPTQFLDTSVNPSDGYVLLYSSGKWKPQPSSAVAGTVQLTQDLGGTSSSPKVIGIQGVSVDSTPPTDGYVFVYSGNTTNKWKAQPSSTIAPSATSLVTGMIKLTGDLGGSSALPQVTGFLGTQIDSSISPLDGYVMLYGSSKWKPTPFLDTTVNPLDGYVLSYSAGKWKPQPSSAVTNVATNSSAGTIQLTKDIGGLYNNPLVTGIQGNPVTNAPPGDGYVLLFKGSQWQPTQFLDTNVTPSDGYLMVYTAATSKWTPKPASSLSVGDASSTTKGVIKLAGDLSTATGGTADSPKVTGLLGKPIDSTVTPSDGYVMVYNTSGQRWIPGKLTQDMILPAFSLSAYISPSLYSDTLYVLYGTTINKAQYTINYSSTYVPASISLAINDFGGGNYSTTPSATTGPIALSNLTTSSSWVKTPASNSVSDTSNIYLYATYGTTTKSVTIYLTWTFNVYYGVADAWSKYSSNPQSLFNLLYYNLQTYRNINYNQTSIEFSSGSKYTYYACPAQYGYAKPSASGVFGGLGIFNSSTGNYEPNATVSLNVNGSIVQYYVYYSKYASTTPISWSIT